MEDTFDVEERVLKAFRWEGYYINEGGTVQDGLPVTAQT